MNKPTKESYSNRFKAKVALEVGEGKSIAELAEKYSVSITQIEQWVHLLEDRMSELFSDTGIPNQKINVKNKSALLESSFETSPNGIIVTDLQQKVIAHNQKFIEMWNIPYHLIKDGNINNAHEHVFSAVKKPEKLLKLINEAFKNPEKEIRYLIELKDGRVFNLQSSPYRTKDGLKGRIANFIDVTEFKKTEAKLTRFSNLLESINANVNEGILRSTPDSGLVYVNDAFVEMFGYNSSAEAMAIEPGGFYADANVRESLIQLLEDNGQFVNAEVLYKRKDGSTFWGLENCTLVEHDGETYIDGVITNIDEWKKAEDELRKSEEKYRSILKNIQEGYFETDLKGNFTFFNTALVDMMGYPTQQMIGMNNREYMNEEEAQKVFNTFNKVYRTGNPEQIFDWELIRGDDSRIYVEASVTLRHDADGNPLGFSGMVRNITERKRKRKQIQESLKEKEVLLGEIHHRVKNNLAVISGLLYLQADRTVDEKASRALMQSQNRINSMALIHELLYDNQTFSSLNPRTYIEQLVEHISSNLRGENSDITTNIQAENFDLEMSTAIPCALIINELITNAFKYAFAERSGGTLEIIFQKRENNTYRLEVADNGSGLPKGFDINDSSKHSLGLSLVKSLTQQLNGELETKNGPGARFIMTFKG